MSSANSSPALAPTLATENAAVENVDVSESSLNGVPELSTFVATELEDKVDGLKLVADSVAQQRQTVSRSILFHPATVALFGLVMAVISHFLYRNRSDIYILGTTSFGVVMAFLACIKWAASPYIEHAETLGWPWLENDAGTQDDIIVTRYGSEVVGSIILRLVGDVATTNGHSKSRKTSKKGKEQPKEKPKALIRGWAVRLRYRGKGVGGDLLDEAIKHVKSKLGSSATIEFAEDHATSFRPLPDTFNRALNREEKKARALLEKAIERYDSQAGSAKR